MPTPTASRAIFLALYCWLASVTTPNSNAAPPVYSWTTLAGAVGVKGNTDGRGNAARFDTPVALCVDAAGMIYVTDFGIPTIRRIDPSGNVTTIAGQLSSKGSADGLAAVASFGDLAGIVVDPDGNLFCTDRYYSTIRKLTRDGVVSTLAGSPLLMGYVDATGSAARFSSPLGIGLDANGNLYAAEPSNSAIRKITQSGEVTTFFTTGAGGVAIAPDGGMYIGGTTGYLYSYIIDISSDLFLPVYLGQKVGGFAFGPDGYIYVADEVDHVVSRVDPERRTIEIIGGAVGALGNVDGQDTDARFGEIKGVAVDREGNVYITDPRFHVIRKGTPIVPRLNWPQPPPIAAGTPLSAIQLNATANLAGTFSYSRPAGTVLPVGVHAVTVTFTPAGTVNHPPIFAETTIRVEVAAPSARLVNIATRGFCSVGDRVMIGGFVISGNAPKQVLVRAVGPSLISRGIGASEVLADPQIEVYRGQPVLTSNDNWGDNLNVAEINATAESIGATPLDSGDTKSAVLLLSLDPGVYSFVATGKAGSSGIVLLEVYDANVAAAQSAFVNIATRAYSTASNGVTIGGFVISGTVPKQVLLRAVGPTLATQGIKQADLLMDPVIELHEGVPVIGFNDDWRSNANAVDITTTGTRIGAMPFADADIKSAALLVTLQPGVYSFVASGKSEASGIVLVEVYDAD